MKDLQKVSDEDLRAELERREHVRRMERREKRKQIIQQVISFREELRTFMKHVRPSDCKHGGNYGFHPDHGDAYCNLCVLNDLDGYEDDIEVIIDISFKKVYD